MRKNDIIVYNGEAHTLGEWCEIKHISLSGLKGRLYRGWSVEKALNTPANVVNRHKSKIATPWDDSNCKGCKYSMTISLDGQGMRYVCDYIGKMGTRRPCEGGDKCTVKIGR